MSAKLLHALTDENPDLQKQIGCMTGIFQLFDRHHILTAKRFNGHSHKRLPSASSHSNGGNLGTEANACSPQPSTNQNQRNSIEPSRASFSSSSCSSSYSSLDYRKTAQPETASLDRITFSDQALKTNQKSQMSDPNNGPTLSVSRDNSSRSSTQSGRQSPSFRDVVKDSIYREIPGSPVRTRTRDYLPKPQDSPRPLLKSVDESAAKIGINRKPRTQVDLNEPLGVLAKLREAPWYFSESRDAPRSSYDSRDGSLFLGSKDASRFSCDGGREIARQSFDSRDNGKSLVKLRELPRLSLDSRECSSRSSSLDLKLCSLSKDSQRGSINQKRSSSGVSSGQPELETNQRPPTPSVVARLMGLDTIPSSTSSENFDRFCGKNSSECSSGLSKMAEKRRDPISYSPKSSMKDPVSPRLRNPDSITKPICKSRFPIEMAPWRQQESGQNPQRTAFRVRDPNVKSPVSQFVYSEIEKRLKDIEFQHSDKNLRALKQLLDAMEAKGLLESKKEQEEPGSNKNQIRIDQNPRSVNKQSTQIRCPISTPIRGSCSPRAFESPIVIMKPAKLINKSVISSSSVIPVDGLPRVRAGKLIGDIRTGNQSDSKKVSSNIKTVKDPTAKINIREPVYRVLGSTEKKITSRIEENSLQKSQHRSIQILSRPHQTAKEKPSNSVKSSSSLSPRLHLKKVEVERKASIPTALPDSGKSRRKLEVGFSGRKLRSNPNPILAPQTEDQLSVISTEARNWSCPGDEVSLQSDSNISLASQVDIEVTSIDRSGELDHYFTQHDEAVSSSKQKNPVLNLSEDSSSSSVESVAVAPEQPSPVSVLDSSFYRDDLLPYVNISVPFQELSEGETRDSDEFSGKYGQNPGDFNAGINQKKLLSIEHLVEKLNRLGLAYDAAKAATKPVPLLCDVTNPDHQYMSEILLASGFLLRDLGSNSAPIPLHRSGHPINPDLFLVLEQTKASRLQKSGPPVGNWVSRSKASPEKLHRKLVFDTVNEILSEKLKPSVSQSEPWVRPGKLARRIPTGQQLLGELCREIESLGADGSEDIDDDRLRSILRSENWTDFSGEISGVVLDVERLIFKDLVDEILSCGGEVWSFGAKPSRRRRQLFVQ